MRMSGTTVLLTLLFGVQVICALFFVSDILLSVFGIYVAPISWRSREIIEIGAAVGLLLGIALGAVSLVFARREARRVRERLGRATSDFADLLDMRFEEWRLTPAERDVAIFAIKGLSTAEIAGLRATSEGTVKAQTAAIYRKAGVNGRGPLLSVFIEDMIDDESLKLHATSGVLRSDSARTAAQ